MNRKIRLLSAAFINTAAIIAAALGVSSACALARDWRDFPAFNNLRTTQEQTIANLNLQRDQIDARITAALRLRQISAQQAADLRGRLQDNSRRQSISEGGGLSFAEAQSILTSLNSIDAQLQTVTAGGGIAGTPSKHKDYYEPSVIYKRNNANEALPQAVTTADLERMQSRISDRLAQGARDNRLSSADCASLKAELDNIAMRKARMIRFRGYLSNEQHSRLLDQLSDLDHRLRAELYDRQYAGRDKPWF